jgi:hypothetical protein
MFVSAWARFNEFANRVAGFVCSQAGATPTLPDTSAKEFGLS